MVQPFLPNIVMEGKFSLFYFGGTLSHIMLKKPREEDFRVQEDFDGVNTLLDISQPSAVQQELVTAADLALQHIGCDLLYARVDLVRHDDTFLLMELKLIEPSLYLRMNKEIPQRFTKAVDSWLKKKEQK